MRDTVKALMESAVTPHADSATKNRVAYSSLQSMSESAAGLMRFVPEKVLVDRVGANDYAIRYSGNIERLMEDQNMKLDEAVQCVANMNNIRVENCIVVFDEASINSGLDIYSIVSGDNEFQIARI